MREQHPTDRAVPVLTNSELKHVEEIGLQHPGGFIDRFIQWGQRKSDASEYALKAGALVALSLAAGDTVVLEGMFGAEATNMNVYVLLVGRSTIVRKSTVLGFARRILPVNNNTGEDYIRTVDDTSIQAFNQTLADAGGTQTPVFVDVDEIAELFGHVKRANHYLAGFDKTLMRAYDHGPLHIARVGKTVDVPTGAFVTVLGASTPDALAEVLAEEDMQTGLLPRFIIFDATDAIRGARRSLMERQADDDWSDETNELQKHLHKIAKGRARGYPEPGPHGEPQFPIKTVGFSDEAMLRLDQLDADLKAREASVDGGQAAVEGRGFHQIVKVAGLFKLSRAGRKGKVELDDVLRAMFLIEESMSDLLTMRTKLGANRDERDIRAVQAMIAASKSGKVSVAQVSTETRRDAWATRQLIDTMRLRNIVTPSGDGFLIGVRTVAAQVIQDHAKILAAAQALGDGEPATRTFSHKAIGGRATKDRVDAAWQHGEDAGSWSVVVRDDPNQPDVLELV